MSAKSTEVQLERMARELIAVAKMLKCSVHLDVTQYRDGGYGGCLFKIDESAVGYDFSDDKRISFTGFVTDKRHLFPKERKNNS